MSMMNANYFIFGDNNVLPKNQWKWEQIYVVNIMGLLTPTTGM